MSLKLNLSAHLLNGRSKVEDCPCQPSAKRPSNPSCRQYRSCNDPYRKEQNPSQECLLKPRGDRFHARFVHEGFGLNKPTVSDNGSKKENLWWRVLINHGVVVKRRVDRRIASLKTPPSLLPDVSGCWPHRGAIQIFARWDRTPSIKDPILLCKDQDTWLEKPLRVVDFPIHAALQKTKTAYIGI